MQAAEQPDQQNDRNWNADQPEKKSASHVILQKVFSGCSHNPSRSALVPESEARTQLGEFFQSTVSRRDGAEDGRALR
jgi:hypothetical protein